jgi:hypothetical protein
MNQPKSIRERWYRRFDRQTGNHEHDYYYVITWPDGSVTERDRIPNDWLHLVDAKPAEVA